MLRRAGRGGVEGQSLPSSLLSVRRRARRLSDGLVTDSRVLCDRARVGDTGSSDQVASAATSETDIDVCTGVGDALTPSGNVMEQTLPLRDRLGVEGHTGVGGLESTGALGRPTICEWRRLSLSGNGGSTKVPRPGTDVIVTVDCARRLVRSSAGGGGSRHDQRLECVARRSSGLSIARDGLRSNTG